MLHCYFRALGNRLLTGKIKYRNYQYYCFSINTQIIKIQGGMLSK